MPLNSFGHQGGHLFEAGCLLTLLVIEVAYSIIRGRVLINSFGHQGGHLFEAGCLLTLLAIRVGAYSRLGAY